MSLEESIESFKQRIKKTTDGITAEEKNKIVSEAKQILANNIASSLSGNYTGADLINNIYGYFNEKGNLVLGIYHTPTEKLGLDKASLLEFGTGITAKNEGDAIRKELGFPETSKQNAWLVSVGQGKNAIFFRTEGLSAHKFLRKTIDELMIKHKSTKAILRANGLEINIGGF